MNWLETTAYGCFTAFIACALSLAAGVVCMWRHGI